MKALRKMFFISKEQLLWNAMGYHYEPLVLFRNKWPVEHCRWCGRLKSPLSKEEFIEQFDGSSLYWICPYHEGTHVDCCTTAEIIVSQRNISRMVLSNILHESWYWIYVCLRFAWFLLDEFITTCIVYARRPYKAWQIYKAGGYWEWFKQQTRT